MMKKLKKLRGKVINLLRLPYKVREYKHQTSAVWRRPGGSPHKDFPHSPELEFLDARGTVEELACGLRNTLGRPLTVLDVGGRSGERADWFPPDSDILVLDLPEAFAKLPGSARGPKVIEGDITARPLTISQRFDIVFSNNVFEHLRKPWIAAEHCLELSRTGGLNIHIAPFAWRYHPVPFDCFRYTHEGFESLFLDTQTEAALVKSGYDISNRRGNKKLQHGAWKDGRDVPPADRLGGFLENWLTFIAVRRERKLNTIRLE